MNKLGDVVFCVDCDRERQAHLEIAEAALLPDTKELDTKEPANPSNPETDPQNSEQDKHPRRMATKKDANGDPLCSQCLDDRQAKRRAEFMLSDDRRTVVHWPRRGRASDPKPVLLSSQGLASQGLASQGLASQGLASQGLASQGLASQGLASIGTAANRSAGSRVGAVTLNAANGTRSKLGKLSTKLSRQDPSKNKAAFVRSLPPGMSAKEVIAQAKKRGLEITPAYVYVIRSNDGARKSNGLAQHAAQEVRAKPNGRPLLNGHALGRVPDRALDVRALRIPKPNDRGIERKFMWLAVELGFLRTEQLLDELRTKIKVVFAH
jgi:hypothetical protein